VNVALNVALVVAINKAISSIIRAVIIHGIDAVLVGNDINSIDFATQIVGIDFAGGVVYIRRPTTANDENYRTSDQQPHNSQHPSCREIV